jgi:hypothetical protein
MVTANEARAMLGLSAHPDGESIVPSSVMSGRAENAEAPPPSRLWKPNGHAHP